MKYRLPDGCTGISHAGKELTVAADATIDLDAATAADLMPHGVEPVAASKTAADKTAAGKMADGKTAGSPDRRILR